MKINSFEHQRKGIYYKGKYIQTYSFGEGDNIVLALPSFPQSGIYYLWLLDKIKFTNLKFITFDLPGWSGYSEDFLEYKSFHLDIYIDIAKEVLNAYKIKEFSILGYSFGGAIGIELASELKHRVKSIVLVSTIINGKKISLRNRTKFLITIAYYLGLHYKIKSYILNVFNDIKKNHDPLMPNILLNNYSDMLNNIDEKIISKSAYDLFHSDWTKYLLNIQDKKIMILNSIDEKLLFKSQAKYIRKILKNEKTIYLHGTHDDFILKPNSKVIQEVIEFLK